MDESQSGNVGRGIEVRELPPGDLMRPSLDAVSGPKDTELYRAVLEERPLWQMLIQYKPGPYEVQTSLSLHFTYESVETLKNKYPIGRIYDPLDFLYHKPKGFDVDGLSPLTEILTFGRGEAPYFLVYEVLHGAGLYEAYRPSPELLEWVGVERREALERRFGENWECVAIMEYCAQHFSPTSLASLAARVLFADCLSPLKLCPYFSFTGGIEDGSEAVFG